MITTKSFIARNKRALRVRSRVLDRSDLPRLIVKRSLKNIHAQIVSSDGKVLAAASSTSLPEKSVTKTQQAQAVGVKLASLAATAKVKSVVLDRGQYRFHGRLKALVESLRAQGIRI